MSRELDAQQFACGALDASFPLVRHLFDVSEEWSAPRQRKGAQIPPAKARRALCAFDGSPCALFTSPEALLQRMRANVSRPGALRVLSPGGNRAVGALASTLGSSPGWVVRNSSAEGGRGRAAAAVQASEDAPDVLLLPRGPQNDLSWLTLPLARHSPALVLVLADTEVVEEEWGGNGADVPRFLDAARAAGFGGR